jgi:DNA-binding transcriptional regulator GbsR (MarR family)
MELDVSSQQVLFQVACTLQSLAKYVDNNTADNLTVLQTEVNSLLQPMLKVQKDIEAQKLMVKKVENEFDDLINEVEGVLDKLRKDLVTAGDAYAEASDKKNKMRIVTTWSKQLEEWNLRLTNIFKDSN